MLAIRSSTKDLGYIPRGFLYSFSLSREASEVLAGDKKI